MAGNTGLIDKLMALPKWALFSIAGILAGAALFGLYLSLAPQKPKDDEAPKSVLIQVPDADVSQSQGALSDIFREERNKADRGSRASNYWDDLVDEQSSQEKTDRLGRPVSEYLDPSVYSETERLQIANGLLTKEQVDEYHRRDAERQAEFNRQMREEAAAARTRSPEYQDSLLMARYEKSLAIAMKYTQQAPAEPEPEPDPNADLRKIEVESDKSILSDDVIETDGIISSLAGTAASGAGASVRPIKATFLKSEKLVSGQRVIVRLLEDLPLSNGTVVPANTHITGICNFRGRMRIDITSLHYGGRMFKTDLSVYDNDGTEGLYCPVSESAKKKKGAAVAGQVAGQVASGAASVLGTILTGNPFLGTAATAGISGVTGGINSQGEMEVSVSAGYEFFIFENVKDNNKG